MRCTSTILQRAVQMFLIHFSGRNGVVPNSDPCQIITPIVLVGQSDSDFNERGNNLAGGRKWAQERNRTFTGVRSSDFA